MSQIKLYQENLLAEVLWDEESARRIALGISETFNGFSFVTGDIEILVFDSELEELYLILKNLFEKEN